MVEKITVINISLGGKYIRFRQSYVDLVLANAFGSGLFRGIKGACRSGA